MNNASEPSNVVDLSQRLDPRSERVGALLVTVRGLATKRLHALASNMFENIDDALFDLAEKAENNAAQTQFFDGMREVRKKRAIVERTFLGQVARDLADFSAGRTRAPESDANARPLANIELSLVGENELEESLAITSMIGKNEQRLARTPIFHCAAPDPNACPLRTASTIVSIQLTVTSGAYKWISWSALSTVTCMTFVDNLASSAWRRCCNAPLFMPLDNTRRGTSPNGCSFKALISCRRIRLA